MKRSQHVSFPLTVFSIPLAAWLALGVLMLSAWGDVQRHPDPASDQQPRMFFVTADGSASGDGSPQRPWHLGRLMSEPPRALRPGDVVWIREGIYRGPFVSRLSGTPKAPITLRAYPGEHVRLDLYTPNQREQGFFILGSHVIYQGFEVTTSNPGPRQTDQSGPFQTDVNRGGISVRGDHNKLINLVIHDLNAGIGYWGNAGEIHGCIVFNNGWLGPDRAHGHGLYLQNEQGTKLVSDNILFNQFGAGIHCYGSEKAHLNNLTLVGNASFNNGAAAGQGYRAERDVLVGGGTVARKISLNQNYTFQNGLDGVVDVGYLWGPENEDVRVTENYFVGSFRFLKPFSEIVFRRNRVLGKGRLVSFTTPADEDVSTAYDWDKNQYTSSEPVAFGFDGLGDESRQAGDLDWPEWRRLTGFDHGSRLTPFEDEPQVFARANRYERGRANVVVYNWSRRSRVRLDLSSVLEMGDRFELRNALNFYGPPVADSIYYGQRLEVALRARSAPSPLGYDGGMPVGTDARFSVFVVRRLPGDESVGEWVRRDQKGGSRVSLQKPPLDGSNQLVEDTTQRWLESACCTARLERRCYPVAWLLDDRRRPALVSQRKRTSWLRWCR